MFGGICVTPARRRGLAACAGPGGLLWFPHLAMLRPRAAFVLLWLFGLAAAFAHAGPAVFDVRAFGAKGDGRTLDSDAINRAIAAAGAAGGGTVLFPAGDYLSHTVRLRSRIVLHLDAGATLLAAEPPAPGQPGGYDAPEANPHNLHQDFGHTHFRNSLIWGDGLEDVAITGPGRIYGRGLSRGNGRLALPVGARYAPEPAVPPDVLEADGPVEFAPRPELKTGPWGHPKARDRLDDGVGNKAIALVRCRNVTLRDFTLLHGGHVGVLATEVDNLTIDNLRIDTNRDGIDLDSCRNVRVANCSVNAPWDDAICLKSSCPFGVTRTTENVTISDCFVSGYDEGTLLDGTRRTTWITRGGPHGRIKLGTESSGGFRRIAIANCVFEHCRGLALEQVDGGVLEDVVVSNLVMRDVQNTPLFLRLGARLRSPGNPPAGSVKRIKISQVIATDVAPEYGLMIVGLPGHPIEDVSVRDVLVEFRGGGTAAQAVVEIPEYETDYPEPSYPGRWGALPAWGAFVRHAKNVAFSNVELRVAQPDARPALRFEDVHGAELVAVKADGRAGAPVLWLKNVSGFASERVAGVPDRAVPRELNGEAKF